MKIANYIDGQYQVPEKRQYLESIEPATGLAYARVPDSTAADIDAAVAAAKRAFHDWSRTSTETRARILERIAKGIEKRLDAFAEAESKDQGKPVSLARQVDIPRAVHNFRYFAGLIRHHDEQATHMDGQALNYTHRKPVGVAGLISPWNLPLYLLTWKIAPALAVGNAAVCKPSEMTSLTAFLLADVMAESHLPHGVCNLVMGRGPSAGAALVAHPDVPLISFTGGTATAKSIITDSAPHFKKLSLELGGKNANIIFGDADLEACIPTAIRSSFTNQGEVCLCGSRIFVQDSILDDFLQAFQHRTAALKVGDPKDPESDLGALISQPHLEKVAGYVTLAEQEGGQVLFGGNRPKIGGRCAGGYFFNPTIIIGLRPGSRTMQEEIFGPVITITTFKDENEVIAMANGTKYGLSASIWTRDVGRAHRVAQAMDAGIIWVNTWMLRDLRTPFGGMKASGIGREGGRHSIDFYMESQNICIKY